MVTTIFRTSATVSTVSASTPIFTKNGITGITTLIRSKGDRDSSVGYTQLRGRDWLPTFDDSAALIPPQLGKETAVLGGFFPSLSQVFLSRIRGRICAPRIGQGVDAGTMYSAVILASGCCEM